MNEFDMSRMQQDAVNRVREMQKRAKTSLESAQEKGKGDRLEQKKKLPERNSAEKKAAPSPREEGGKNRAMDFLRLFNFGKLEEDGDRSLILLILILLASDECDELLLLVLVYLLI